MIPLKTIFEYCRKMLQEKWGYIWGTAGIKWTEARQQATSNDMAKKYGSKWIGHMVADCSGVMVYIWKQCGKTIYHGSNTIARKYVGEISKTPQPGYAAFKWKSTDTSKFPDGKGDFYHIGIVAEDGVNVYEAKGTQAGFVTSKASSWHYFAPFKDVDYSDNQKEDEPIMTEYIGKVKVTSGTLNMRAAANASSKIIMRLDKDKLVKVIGEESNGWLKVEVDGEVGYVSGKYIEKVEDVAPEPTPEPEPIIPKVTYYGVFIPCTNEAAAKELGTKYPGSTIINYQSSNGEDG